MNRKTLSVGMIMMVVVASYLSSSRAATILPGSVNPSQVSQAITEEQPQPTLKTVAPITPPKETPSTPGGEAAKKIKFKLNAIVLEGNVRYSDDTLRTLYADKLHRVITVAELYEIVQAISNYYRNNGYIISRAILLPQHVKGGVVKIQIIEGFIDEVGVAGTPFGAQCLIKAFGERIKACKPLAIKRMEYYLLLANEIPATYVRSVLAPSKTTTGAADLTLIAENKPITGYFSYDNYGTLYIGPQQITGNIGLNSMFFSGDSTQVTVVKTPKGGELTYNDFNYNVALDDEGNRWLIGTTHAYTYPLFVLRPAKLDGSNINWYTSFFFPIIRERSQNLTAQVSLNYQDSTVNTLSSTLYTDHLRSLGIGLTYNLSDSYGGTNNIYADVRQGLPVLGYTSDTSIFAQTSRPGGRGDYTKIDVQISRLQALKGPLSFYALIKGQYGFNPLLASEQFTYGGSVLGRGYDIAELIGDKGIAGTAELRYDLFLSRLIQDLQFYLYYDAGIIWDYLFIPGSPIKQSGMTTGVGMRFYFSKYISGNIMWTQVLTKPIAAEQFIGRGNRPRIFFSAVFSF